MGRLTRRFGGDQSSLSEVDISPSTLPLLSHSSKISLAVIRGFIFNLISAFVLELELSSSKGPVFSLLIELILLTLTSQNFISEGGVSSFLTSDGTVAEARPSRGEPPLMALPCDPLERAGDCECLSGEAFLVA